MARIIREISIPVEFRGNSGGFIVGDHYEAELNRKVAELEREIVTRLLSLQTVTPYEHSYKQMTPLCGTYLAIFEKSDD